MAERRRRNYEEPIVSDTVKEELPVSEPVVEETVVDEIPVSEPVVEEVKASENKKYCSVIAARLNLRAKPTVEAAVKEVINIGDKLEITSDEEDFFGVKTEKGLAGYVMKEFVAVL